MKDKAKYKWLLVAKVSAASDHYGNLLIECMEKYKVSNTTELTAPMLRKFIKKRGIK